MAFLREHSPSQDKGEWYDIGNDPDNHRIVRVRVRRMPEATQRSIEEKYGVERDDVVEGESGKGTAKFTVRRRIHSLEDLRSIRLDRAQWAWLDCQNFSIEPLDEETAKKYADFLGNDTPVEARKPLVLDGRLTPAMKQYILQNFDRVARIVDEKAMEHSRKEATEEVALAKN